MPCENCNAQFSVFKRKKTCTECSRLICNQCLIKLKEKILCERCVIFTKRPLTKIELLKLKPKDLIFYLQSKHISTTGCVEKEELVNLILAHINANNYQDHHNNGNSTNNNSSDNCSNPFDQIKQTCQNLFHSFTEKIDIPFDYFDIKPSQSTSNGQQGACQSNISTQPRSTSSTNLNNHQQQQIPNNHINPVTSANRLNNPTTTTTSTPINGSLLFNINIQPNNNVTSNNLSNPIKNTINIHAHTSSSSQLPSTHDLPINGTSANEKLSSPTHTNQINMNDLPSVQNNTKSNKTFKLLTNFNDIIACDCSDDESFKNLKLKYDEQCLTNNLPGPSGNKTNSHDSNKILNTSESSESLSSFEELGAVGGRITSGCSTRINDGIPECSIAGTSYVPSTSSDTENWQFIHKTDDECKKEKIPYDNDDDDDDGGYFDDKNIKFNDEFLYNYNQSKQSTAASSSSSEKCLKKLHKKQKHSINDSDTIINKKNDLLNKLLIERNQRKLTRRRSDSYILGKKQKKQNVKTDIDCYNIIDVENCIKNDDENIDSNEDDENNDEQITIVHCCNKCGKSKNSIKKHILKFRKQLEIKTITESEKSKQLNDFLLYLEEKTKNSFDYSDDSISEDLITADTTNATGNILNLTNDDEQQQPQHTPQSTTRITINNIHDGQYYEDELILEDDAMHVDPINNIYNNVPNNLTSNKKESIRKYLKLNDISSSDQLENLSVKQLKEILILNRVDFKGCCEKNELLERAQRLWNDYVSCPSADKLPTDDLCKICMDAPIECVILECGHLATCTDCGKVLSECPICRQYVVRVVRIFRA